MSGTRVISALDGLFVALASALSTPGVPGDEPLARASFGHILMGNPGATILYSERRLSDSERHPSVYPRIVVLTFGGVRQVLRVLVLIERTPTWSIDRPHYASPLATALPSAAGSGLGVNEAGAVSRAGAAKEHAAVSRGRARAHFTEGSDGDFSSTGTDDDRGARLPRTPRTPYV